MGGVAAESKDQRSGLVPAIRERLARPWFGTVLAATALCMTYLAAALINWADVADRSLYANVGMLPVGLAATILAWIASQRQPDPRSTWAWRALSLSLGCFFLGDSLYFFYQNLLGKSPFPSAADVAYLAYYPLMLAGLLAFPNSFRDRAHRASAALDGLLAVAAGAMMITYFFLIPTADSSADDLLAYGLSVGYPLGDLLLLAGVAYLLMGRGTHAAHLSLYLLAGGLVIGLAADLVYGYQSMQGALQAGGLSDAGYMVSWVLFAWAGYTEYARTDRSNEVDGGERRASKWRVYLPYAFVVTGPALLIYDGRGSWWTSTGFLILATSVLVLALGARQWIALRYGEPGHGLLGSTPSPDAEEVEKP